MPYDFSAVAEPLPSVDPGAKPAGSGFDFSQVAEPLPDQSKQYAGERLAEFRDNRQAAGLNPLPMAPVGDDAQRQVLATAQAQMLADPNTDPAMRDYLAGHAQPMPGAISQADLLDHFARTLRAAQGETLPETGPLDPLKLGAEGTNIGMFDPLKFNGSDPGQNIIEKAGMQGAGNLVAGLQGALGMARGALGNAEGKQELMDQSGALRELSADVAATNEGKLGHAANIASDLAPWLVNPIGAAVSVGGNRASDVEDAGGSATKAAAAGTAEGALSVLIPQGIGKLLGKPAQAIESALIARFGAPAVAEALAQVPIHAGTGAALPLSSAAVSASTGDMERAKQEASVGNVLASMGLMGGLGVGSHLAAKAPQAIQEAIQARTLENAISPPGGAQPVRSQVAEARASLDPANAQQQAPASAPVDVQRALDLRQQQRPGVDPATIRAQQEADAATKANAEQLLADQRQATAGKVQRDQEQAAQVTAKAEADARMETARAKAVSDQTTEQAKAINQSIREEGFLI